MSEWKTIDSFVIPPFVKETWFHSVTPPILLASGRRVYIGAYHYTQNGVGRWKDASGYNASPTHWMLLPEPPQ